MTKYATGWMASNKDKVGVERILYYMIPGVDNVIIVDIPGTRAKMVIWKYFENPSNKDIKDIAKNNITINPENPNSISNIFLYELTTNRRKVLGIGIKDKQLSVFYDAICQWVEICQKERINLF